jgi:hypothetical protein
MFQIIITAVISSGITSVILGFLVKTWVEARIKASVEHEYKKQFELFSRGLDRKEKIELVAELIAEYLKIPKGEKMPREQRILLNKLSFKATLWLPPDLAVELSKRLQNKPDAKAPFELILMARKELIGDASLELNHVTFWSPHLEEHGDPVIIPPK